MEKRVLRSDIKAFYGVPGSMGDPTFTRMKGFTDASTSKNPIEYEAHYVDEKNSTTSVTGYSPSIAFTLDRFDGNAVHDDIVELFTDEVVGSDAERYIVMVDFTKAAEGNKYPAVKRKFAVIGDSEGSGVESMQYSGNFKTAGASIHGFATIATPDDGDPETVETITFSEE
ncbi:MAG: hypothetical protein IKY39_03345 [Clostridia bacterium]|nr:hypothetical protein [Clostridia bacterium]